MRTVVDPRFGHLLANLVMAHGLSQAALARTANVSPGHLSELIWGKKHPSEQTARALDNALDAGGRLAALVAPAGADIDLDRVASATSNPRDVNPATIQSLQAVLIQQRHLDDTLGSAALLAPVLAQLDTVSAMVREAAGQHRPVLLSTAAQWAQFAGWLHANVGRMEQARHWFGRALEWATEAGDIQMIATALSYQGHVAWLGCLWGPVVGLSDAALRDPDVYPGQRAYDAFQAARGHAAMGHLDEAKRMLTWADELTGESDAWAGEVPMWQYYRAPWYWSLERGLAHRYLARWDVGYVTSAVTELRAGVDGMPAEMRGADWAAEYLVHLTGAYADAGADVAAWETLAEARRVADATRSPRVRRMVEQRERMLSVQ